jgi:hypothetical protein
MASLSPEMPPDVQSFAELAQKPGIMMIYHLLMRACRHFHLLMEPKSVLVGLSANDNLYRFG